MSSPQQQPSLEQMTRRMVHELEATRDALTNLSLTLQDLSFEMDATHRRVAASGEQLDADTINRDDCCEIGKWLHGAGGSIYGGNPTFMALIAGHKAFYAEAAKVARAVNQGCSQVAQMMDSGTPFVRASNEVGQLIVQIKREFEKEPKPAMRRATPRVLANAKLGANTDDWTTF